MKPNLPTSNAFWLLSSAYLDGGDAAHGLIRSNDYSGFAWLPCVFLYFRCIELALKAVLVSNGVAEQEIARTFGHRISALLIRSEEFIPLSDLGILPSDRKLLDRFSDDYSDKWFEYPDKLWRGNPQLDQLKDLAHRVCATVRTHGRRKP
jgi:hypothetical protein